MQNVDYTVSADKDKLDLEFIHHSLSREAYWSIDIPLETVKRSIENSMCFGVYVRTSGASDRQIGFARVITDYATFGYLADVFIAPEYRGKGLSKMMMAAIMDHPSLQGFRRWLLMTRDAHGLYKQFGWIDPPYPERYMEIAKPDLYKR